MAIHPNKSGKIIFTGIYKVLNQASPKWVSIRDQPISQLFVGVANPTSWKTFFLEAIGTSIQQELILNQSYCPGLEDRLKELHDGGQTWAELESFVQAEVRTVQVTF